MKKEYKRPEMEIYELMVEDIITASGMPSNPSSGSGATTKFNPKDLNLDSGEDWYGE